MKRTIIGGVIMCGGIILTLGIILSAAIYVPHMTSWSGKSKLWFAIFGGPQYGDEVVQSLFLSFPFTVGVILSVTGLIILALEYFCTHNKEL